MEVTAILDEHEATGLVRWFRLETEQAGTWTTLRDGGHEIGQIVPIGGNKVRVTLPRVYFEEYGLTSDRGLQLQCMGG